MVQEVAQQLQAQFGCYPVFLGAELKNNYYKSELPASMPAWHWTTPCSHAHLGSRADADLHMRPLRQYTASSLPWVSWTCSVLHLRPI